MPFVFALVVFAALVFSILLTNVLVSILKCFRDKKIEEKSERLWSASSTQHTPVILVAGFLGSGKTTLLNHIIRNSNSTRVAVVENELGSVSIDHSLLNYTKNFGSRDVFVLKNGCICCSGQSGSGTDILRILDTLIDLNEQESQLRASCPNETAFDCVLVELSGMADLGVIIQTFLKHQHPRGRFYLDGAITIVDADNIAHHVSPRGRLDAIAIEAERQVAYADVILVNKCAHLSQTTIESAKKMVRTINKTASLITTDLHSWADKLDVAPLLNIRAFSPDSLVDTFQSHPELFGGDTLVHSPSDIRSLSFDVAGEVSLDLFHEFVRNQLTGSAVEAGTRSLLRVKGILSIHGHPNERYVFHGVHENVSGVFEPVVVSKDNRTSGERRCQLVLIGKGLDQETTSVLFRRCFVRSADGLARGLGSLNDIVGSATTAAQGTAVW